MCSVFTQFRDTALMMAVRMDEATVVKELINGGANLNRQNKVCLLCRRCVMPCLAALLIHLFLWYYYFYVLKVVLITVFFITSLYNL